MTEETMMITAGELSPFPSWNLTFAEGRRRLTKKQRKQSKARRKSSRKSRRINRGK